MGTPRNSIAVCSGQAARNDTRLWSMCSTTQDGEDAETSNSSNSYCNTNKSGVVVAIVVVVVV